MSCKTISNEGLDKTIPVKPLTVNKKQNPKDHSKLRENENRTPWNVSNHLNTLIPVGTTMIIVAVVK